MRPVSTFHVHPALPDRLRSLEELAYNLRWSWDHETISLFRRLDRDLWETTGHNPVLMLGTISQERLKEALLDEAFLAHMDRVAEGLSAYLTRPGTWHRRSYGAFASTLVAYFSMEFGLTECLPIYSGGLGILAGDHLKSASDLGLPMVGVGILYQKGYFRQRLSPEGWQLESYPVNDFYNMPVRLVRNEAGEPIRVKVELAGQTALVQVWRVQVGRVTLLLLDTNIPGNPREINDVTDELYSGDGEMRIRQEILLGMGGMRALDALGLRAKVYHLNEGHCAFLALERIRILMRENRVSFDEAREVVTASTVFTTHTPVPAGIDVFPGDMVRRYFQSYLTEVGLAPDALLDLGRVHPGDANEQFNMAVLALRTSCYVNAVSRLHGKVSRAMWKEVWPGIPAEEIPIAHVTNGVHALSWISDDMHQLYDRYLGPRWAEEPGDTRVWEGVEDVPAEELWRTHERRRERLVAFTRRRLAEMLRKSGAGQATIEQAGEVLDPAVLTIGFSRRFAPYKRATLLLSDPERLGRILNNPNGPVQIIYAGKAHPRDDYGKELIRQIVQLARRPEFRRRIVFLEDYDTDISRYLVQGVDVWLNTPRRPMEASGTSGMKAAMNGALNLSILDGWWDEACSQRTGWAIGTGEESPDPGYQDRVEAGTLYDLLEREVVPLFYERGPDRIPRGWTALMKSAMRDLCPVFNTNRMVCQYTTEAYHRAAEGRGVLQDGGFQRARALTEWRGRVKAGWRDVRITRVEAEIPDEVRVGLGFDVKAWVSPGSLSAGDLLVQLWIGRVDESQAIVDAEVVNMVHEGSSGKELIFKGTVPCNTSGMRGFTVRVIPHHEDLRRSHQTGLITWAS